MGHCSTILRQILHLVPRYVFERLAAQHHGGAALRTMTRWSQFVALVAAQLSGRASLRDLEASLAAQRPRLYHLGVRVPPRSSLSRVNAEQPYSLYEALCAQLLERCSALAPRHGFRFKHKLYTLDSSFIELSLMVFPWASYKSAKGAAKLHVGLDHEGYLPAFVSLTDGQDQRHRRGPPARLAARQHGGVRQGLHRLRLVSGADGPGHLVRHAGP